MLFRIPVKYLEALFIKNSKFWQTLQQLCLNGILPWSFTNFGLYLRNVLSHTFLVVLANKLYMLQLLLKLFFIKRLPVYFLSGKGNVAWSLSKKFTNCVYVSLFQFTYMFTFFNFSLVQSCIIVKLTPLQTCLPACTLQRFVFIFHFIYSIF